MHAKLIEKMFLYLGNNLSVRAKRLILISSAAAVYNKAIVDDNALIDQLNKAFNLAHSNRAAAYPMYIKDIVWKSTETLKPTTACLPVPRWLQYPEATNDLAQLNRFLAHTT